MAGGSAPVEGFAPGRHLIDAYGRGGFRFGGMSHRGSILALPSGTGAWSVARFPDLRLADLRAALSETPSIDFLILGTGAEIGRVPERIRTAFREAGISIDAMATGAAARTYNILLAENRRVGAALIAVE